MEETPELEKFNNVLQKILSVPREELMKREKEWKRKQARKKQARTAPYSRSKETSE